ncbi:hypothetical protein [Arenicella sp. 4NH20-0111]|uniref:hypothetical protein n=1 Tax=Arenicella sp. 4NH20-0111 TaxID=3127648 RepID=UPI0033400342
MFKNDSYLIELLQSLTRYHDCPSLILANRIAGLFTLISNENGTRSADYKQAITKLSLHWVQTARLHECGLESLDRRRSAKIKNNVTRH